MSTVVLTPQAKKMQEDIEEAMQYMRDGGLGEIESAARCAFEANMPTIKSDSVTIVALCLLAQKGLENDPAKV